MGTLWMNQVSSNCDFGVHQSRTPQWPKGCGPDPHQFSGSSSRDVSQTTYLRPPGKKVWMYSNQQKKLWLPHIANWKPWRIKKWWKNDDLQWFRYTIYRKKVIFQFAMLNDQRVSCWYQNSLSQIIVVFAHGLHGSIAVPFVVLIRGFGVEIA